MCYDHCNYGSCGLISCLVLVYCFVFFFKQKTAYEMRISDWSSDVCSSDLPELRNRSAVVLRKSSIITASDTLASGISTLVSATTSGLSAEGSSSSALKTV